MNTYQDMKQQTHIVYKIMKTQKKSENDNIYNIHIHFLCKTLSKKHHQTLNIYTQNIKLFKIHINKMKINRN